MTSPEKLATSVSPAVVGPPVAVTRKASTGAGTTGAAAARYLTAAYPKLHGCRKLSPPGKRSLGTGPQTSPHPMHDGSYTGPLPGSAEAAGTVAVHTFS